MYTIIRNPSLALACAVLLGACSNLPPNLMPDAAPATGSGFIGPGTATDSSVFEVTGAPDAVFRQTAAGAQSCTKFARWLVDAKYTPLSHSGVLTFSSPGEGPQHVLATARLYEKSPGVTAMDLVQARPVAGRLAPFPFASALPRWAFGDTSYCPIR